MRHTPKSHPSGELSFQILHKGASPPPLALLPPHCVSCRSSATTSAGLGRLLHTRSSGLTSEHTTLMSTSPRELGWHQWRGPNHAQSVEASELKGVMVSDKLGWTPRAEPQILQSFWLAPISLGYTLLSFRHHSSTCFLIKHLLSDYCIQMLLGTRNTV